MEPVTLIVTALAAGAAAGLKPTAEKAVEDAYVSVKTLITKRFGEKKDLQEALQKLEAKPERTGRQEELRDELAEAGAGEDAEVVAAAQALLDALQARPEGQQIVQHVTGNRNIFSGTGDVNVRGPL